MNTIQIIHENEHICSIELSCTSDLIGFEFAAVLSCFKMFFKKKSFPCTFASSIDNCVLEIDAHNYHIFKYNPSNVLSSKRYGPPDATSFHFQLKTENVLRSIGIMTESMILRHSSLLLTV